MDTRINAVLFNEDEHRYTYNGKELHGVTGAIGKLMGKSFPDTEVVRMAALYGSDVHKDVENHYNVGRKELSSEGAKWVVEELERFGDGLIYNCVTDIASEVLVSDFEGTASKVDVVMHTAEGAYLYDIKTTSAFDREYCSLQLSVYQYLYEKVYGEKVLGLFVLGTKSKRRFHILYQGDEKVQKILKMNLKEST